MRLLFVLLIPFLGVVAPTLAEDPAPRGLTGRIVEIRILTYDDPARPLFVSRYHRAVVGQGVEFPVTPDGRGTAIDTVPVIVNVSPWRITFDYSETRAGHFYVSEFNGYEIAFRDACALISGGTIDLGATSLPLNQSDLVLVGNTLTLNLSGHVYDAATRIAIDLDLNDCPLS